MASDKKILKVVMFPWLAHGHISPFLDLAKRLTERNFECYICSTPVNLSSIQKKIPEKYSFCIHLVELHLPSSTELPPHYHTTNGLPLNLHSSLRRALKMAKPEFLNILKNLEPDLLIHDILQPWAGSAAALNKIPTVTFFTSGATMFSYFCHLGMHPATDFPFESVRLTSFELSMALGNIEDAEVDREEHEASRKTNLGILMNSSRAIEGKYMDYLSEMINTKIIPIGAFVEDPNITSVNDEDSDIMEWLSRKDDFSSIYVSFGSEYFLKKEEIEEIGIGLELSNVNFIWVIRFPKGEDVKAKEVLPQNFLERVGERGKIVEKWAPQAKILSHSSIGGFVSHCGWNSIKESIEYGVPVIAMPMHLDQPMNAKLVVELGVGVEVKRDDEGRFQRDNISNSVKDVLVGESFRRKVGEVRENIRVTSREELEELTLKLTQFCAERVLL